MTESSDKETSEQKRYFPLCLAHSGVELAQERDAEDIKGLRRKFWSIILLLLSNLILHVIHLSIKLVEGGREKWMIALCNLLD